MAIYFISDLHLKPQRPDLSRALLCFLDQITPDAEALYLLGDIFEAWIGDDAPDPALENIYTRLATLSQTCSLFFQHGNRDFLVGSAFCERIGATLLPEYTEIDLPFTKALLLHGDQLCTDDTDYMAFRMMVRKPEWQRAFLAKSVTERLNIAKQLREASQAQGAMKSTEITDVNSAAVLDTFAEHQVKLMIHGHTHRPKIHHLILPSGETAERVVLGDWDALGWFLRADSQGYSLESFPIKSD